MKIVLIFEVSQPALEKICADEGQSIEQFMKEAKDEFKTIAKEIQDNAPSGSVVTLKMKD